MTTSHHVSAAIQASTRRGQAMSRARRLGQIGVSAEEREAAWDRRLALLRCGHRVGERPGEHDAKDCRERLDAGIDGWLGETSA